MDMCFRTMWLWCRGGAKKVILVMPEKPLDEHTDPPPCEESIALLHRSGWSTGEAAFTGSSGRTVWQVDGRNGENRLLAHGATQREAWHRAVEQAAACGMLADWPRPSGDGGGRHEGRS